jgi:hypothetical protein
MAVIMAEGLFHLKRGVGAFIHAGSCYKIEGQFILKKILTTMICTCKVVGNRSAIGNIFFNGANLVYGSKSL